MPGLGREFDEGLMQDASGGFDHFSVVVVAAVQTDRYLKVDGPALDLKRDADLRIGMTPGRLDAGHLDLEFAHRFIPPAPSSRTFEWSAIHGRTASEVGTVEEGLQQMAVGRAVGRKNISSRHFGSRGL